MPYVKVTFEGILAVPVDLRNVHVYMLEGLRKFAEDIAAEFDKTVQYWATQPEFTYSVHDKKDEISTDVGTNDVVWNAIDQGVPGRIIPIKTPGVRPYKLFVSGSMPGTVNTKPSVSVTQGAFWLEHGIDWPGIQARKWSQTIKQIAEDHYNLQGTLQEILDHYAATQGLNTK